MSFCLLFCDSFQSISLNLTHSDKLLQTSRIFCSVSLYHLRRTRRPIHFQMTVSFLIFSDFQRSCVHKKRPWRNAIAMAVSTSTPFMGLLTPTCEQAPTFSGGSEQKPSSRDAHSAVGRPPAGAAATLLPPCRLSGREEPQKLV